MVRRRSRVVLVVAVVIVFLLYRVFQNSEWDPTRVPSSPKVDIPTAEHAGTHGHSVEHPFEDENEQNPQPPAADAKANAKPDAKADTKPDAKDDTKPVVIPDAGDTGVPEPEAQAGDRVLPFDQQEPVRDDPFRDTTKTGPAPPVPDTGKPDKSDHVLHPDDIRVQKPPSRQPEVSAPVDAAKTQIHWRKQTEHFPVPTESIIPLPTGKPKQFPKIQHAFTPEAETAANKETRQKRLALVKAEAKRSWDGYRKFAWTHDELSPMSERFRDPFCGWAATMVDALDTLWIMGLKEEFKEAVEAVADIDFTYSDKRRDIPVFETIIRYLGGLLAAYDVSGGHDGDYPVLLNKATELAEILMGVFDTPNRMPILYYNWMPDFASQPHRAGTGSIAEIATMSMEFTRLAQLTGKNKYYDAIARITNALKDLQDRGTSIPGIFPESLDISGCNKTATSARNAAAEEKAEAKARQDAAKLQPPPEGYVPGQDTVVAVDDAAEPEADDEEAPPPAVNEAPAPKGGKAAGGTPNAPEEPAVARRALRVDEEGGVQAELDPNQKDKNYLTPDDLPSYPGSSTGDERARAPIAADGKFASWDCIEQGIVPSGYGYEQYSMGGSQDSAYEYFPKEDLMLGGLVPVYKELHIGTVEAIKKSLLYRAMAPKDREVLFTAKITTSGDIANDARYEYEVTHLTCFLGGMFGLGAQIYDRPEDLEIAKKLTDGCVWAYESMPSGIMPEGSNVVPCASLESCPYNETLWWQYLDPSGEYRDNSVKEWEEKQTQKKADQATMMLKDDEDTKLRVQQEERRKAEQAEAALSESPKTPVTVADGEAAPAKEMFRDDEPRRPVTPDEEVMTLPVFDDEVKPPIFDEVKPPVVAAVNPPVVDDVKQPLPVLDDVEAPVAPVAPVVPVAPIVPVAEAAEAHEGHVHAKRSPPPADDKLPNDDSGTVSPSTPKDIVDANVVPATESVQDISGGVIGQMPIEDAADIVPSPAPAATDWVEPKPMNHLEFVKNRIETESIPPGFVSINHRHYILRPEAIESVWYMYRITGDPVWQEKGWRMFEAVVKATATAVGNSAIDDVLAAQPSKTDEMESFWLAETLKYFYLLFADTDVISLDDWVLNTEAHPFRRPKA
ncbi:hypothetical protein ACHAQA_006386 [Verticillium albo-atrum]